MKHTNRLRSSGMTLVEVAISLAVTAAAVLAAASAVNRSFSAWSDMSRTGDLERRDQNAMEVIVAAMSDAGKSTLSVAAPPTGAFSMTFKTPTGFASDATTWSNQSIVEWQPSASDPVNGVDNDGNGLIDDGVVVLRKNVGLSTESKTVLCRWIPYLAPNESANNADDNGDGLNDERGLSFKVVGSALTVRLSCKRKSRDGTMITTTSERTIALRN
jgi:Tfp pilus assembly protein PilW